MSSTVNRALRLIAGAVLLTSLSCARAAPAATSSKPHRVILFVWDGMRPDAVSAEDTPNLLALAQHGSRFEDNHSTYPTFTMANASSFATGAFPGPLGFYGTCVRFLQIGGMPGLTARARHQLCRPHV